MVLKESGDEVSVNIKGIFVSSFLSTEGKQENAKAKEYVHDDILHRLNDILKSK